MIVVAGEPFQNAWYWPTATISTCWRAFVYGDTSEREGIHRVLNELLGARNEGHWEFLLLPLSDMSNIRQLPLKTLLVQLELRGIIAPRYSYFALCGCSALSSETEG